VVITVSLLARIDIPVFAATVRLLGWLIFLIGMFVFAWAVAYLKGVFFGNVEPVSDKLITTGPYRFVRHPLYLGMTISTIGLTIGLRSPWGLGGFFCSSFRLESTALGLKKMLWLGGLARNGTNMLGGPVSCFRRYARRTYKTAS